MDKIGSQPYCYLRISTSRPTCYLERIRWANENPMRIKKGSNAIRTLAWWKQKESNEAQWRQSKTVYKKGRLRGTGTQRRNWDKRADRSSMRMCDLNHHVPQAFISLLLSVSVPKGISQRRCIVPKVWVLVAGAENVTEKRLNLESSLSALLRNHDRVS